jgi:predicted DNA-binding transcriptional regulator YafY
MLTNQFVKTGQLVEMIYISKGGNITQRTVKIHGSNKEKIFGYCFMRKNYRSFNKEQILAIGPYRKRAKLY